MSVYYSQGSIYSHKENNNYCMTKSLLAIDSNLKL